MGLDAVVVDAVRTPSGKGKPGGALSAVHPVDLLAGVLAELIERTGIDPAAVDDVIGGCVSQGGEQSANITRNAVLAAGFPEHVPATTVDRQCGSSQQAVHFAAQGVLAGAYDLAIACGVESMSRVPMFSQYGDADPYGPSLRRRYPPGLVEQGVAAELLARRYELTRAELDEYSAASHARAADAWARGFFADEVVPVGTAVTDETVRGRTTVDGLAGLSPVFSDPATETRFGRIPWMITAGNSSPLTDGASAVLIASARASAALGLRRRARFRSFAVTGDDPILMLRAVVPATEAALKRAGLSIGDIDSFEVNEAFAPVPLVWQRETGADGARLNAHGGAIALGHPLGASGSRLLTTLLTTLEAGDGTFGLQTMCEGGGMANATIIERVDSV
ncbi:thiolase family protein [Qaidamihabitans albus]|uniref:thiolase family protein n=1 Tax=Qaidamihabitans albus TaxID=2795733 RepID=UPI0018F1AEEA|nr:acetyl-CoA C-acyltransferase [Qaidamihabitans albus]